MKKIAYLVIWVMLLSCNLKNNQSDEDQSDESKEPYSVSKEPFVSKYDKANVNRDCEGVEAYVTERYDKFEGDSTYNGLYAADENFHLIIDKVKSKYSIKYFLLFNPVFVKRRDKVGLYQLDFLLEDGKRVNITVTPSEESNLSSWSFNPVSDMVSAMNLFLLSRSPIKTVRAYTSTGNFDMDFKPDDAKRLMNTINCIRHH